MDIRVQYPEIAVIPGDPPPRDTLCDFRDSTYTLYVRSRGKVLAEYAVEGTPPPRRKYIYAGDTRIAMIDYFGDLYFYLNDHLGSARVVVADSSGAAFDKYSYYAFGGNLSTTTSTNQTHRYTGKPLDEENGLNLYYYGARYYDPDVGVFRAVDPLKGKYPGWSPYAYVRNNPLRLIDPTGMADEEPQEEVQSRDRGAITQAEHAVVVVERVATVVESGKKMASEIAEEAVALVGQAADAVEEPLGVAGAAVTLAGAVPSPASPALLATGTTLTVASLGTSILKTSINPTPENVTNLGIQLALAFTTRGIASGIRSGMAVSPNTVLTPQGAKAAQALTGVVGTGLGMALSRSTNGSSSQRRPVFRPSSNSNQRE